ncbi:MAG: HAD family hydrolase [Proteobacteria bacterium]|nr:HAD family hydrolase [Pseudomonadota bacterium]
MKRTIMDMDDVHGIFFDFDGVILDSTRIKTQTFRDMFSSFGESIVERVVEHHIANGGISRVEKIDHYYRHFLNRPLSEMELADKCLDFSERVKDNVIACQWIPGAEEFLENFHQRLPLFVISGTPEDELSEIVERRGMTKFFKRILGSPIKKPVHVRQLVAEFDWNPAFCFFIGDAMTDYDTAKETGARFVGIQSETQFPDSTVVLPDCVRLEQTMRETRSAERESSRRY